MNVGPTLNTLHAIGANTTEPVRPREATQTQAVERSMEQAVEATSRTETPRADASSGTPPSQETSPSQGTPRGSLVNLLA